jgi:hypothetical protein
MQTKKTYTAPDIAIIQLDNEISLALESIPPGGPGESLNMITTPEYFNNNPFISQLS